MGWTSKVGRWAAWITVAYLVTRVVPTDAGDATPTVSQATYQVFRKAASSVVAIRARGRDVMAPGEPHFTETGSGVLISNDGQVLTAAYVVHGMDEISVEFPDGETVRAQVVTSEPAAADLSLLQLERVPPSSTVSAMGDSDTVKIGDTVLIVGAPSRLSYPLEVGAIGARWAPNTAYRTMPAAEFFQTDATIDIRNSGGPMFNLRGEVIGIVSSNISRGDRNEEQGFVVTVNTAKCLLLGVCLSPTGARPASTTAEARPASPARSTSR